MIGITPNLKREEEENKRKEEEKKMKERGRRRKRRTSRKKKKLWSETNFVIEWFVIFHISNLYG